MLRRLLLLGLLTTGALAGCQSREELGVVEGHVTIDGRPVSDATLFLRNRDRGIHIMAKIGEEGFYRVFTAGGEGLPLGDYVVEVASNPAAMQTDPDTGEIRATRKKVNRVSIPERYQNIATSGLALTVGSGRNEFNVEMHSEKRK